MSVALPSATLSSPDSKLPSLAQAQVTFTGKLAFLGRAEAYQLVQEAGGKTVSGVSRRTSLVVVGMAGWPLLPDGQVSRKLQRAEAMIRKGHPIKIISEALFLELVGRRERQSILKKTYPLEEVLRLLKLPAETLRRWEYHGLVRSENGHYDFQDLVSLRTIADLVGQGVDPGTIAKSLIQLETVLPEVERPLAQLKLLSGRPSALLVDVGESLLAPNGQLMINFDRDQGALVSPLKLPPRPPSPQDWFEHGQALEEDECYPEAEEAYRMALAESPHHSEVFFNLGNVLRVIGKVREAESNYRAAVSQDPTLAVAWFNLADLQEERGDFRDAIDSLKMALKACETYADAHFNLALCYQRTGQKEKARHHWQEYLKLDPSSHWSRTAKDHLRQLD